LGRFFGSGLLFRRLFLYEFGMVPKRISDEFAALPFSYMRKKWLRRIRDGVCCRCGETRDLKRET
jgi:hypothetical protein